MSEDFTFQLANSKLLSALAEGELAALAAIATPVHFKKGEVVFREGEVGDAFYQVVEGRLSIKKRDAAGADREVAVLKEHDILGEMSLLSNAPRSASVVCTEDAQLLRILKTDFDALLDAGNAKANRIVWHMSGILCQRVREMNEALLSLLSREATRATPEFVALRDRLMKDWTF